MQKKASIQFRRSFFRAPPFLVKKLYPQPKIRFFSNFVYKYQYFIENETKII